VLQVKVTDVPGFDGTYEWDPERQFNGHELHLVKKVAGVRLGEIEEALAAGDYDVIVAITAIMVCRSGRVTRAQVPELVEMLLDADGGKITIEEAAEVADDRPPSVASPEIDSTSDASESSELSSVDSRSTGDDHPAISLRAIGSPG
jgi:hypothetical protein